MHILFQPDIHPTPPLVLEQYRLCTTVVLEVEGSLHSEKDEVDVTREIYCRYIVQRQR